MATFQRRLSVAQIALNKGDFKYASSLALDALAMDDRSYREAYEAHLVVGRAAFYRGDFRMAEAEYQQAADIDPLALPAWEGLASAQMTEGRYAEGVEAYGRLYDLAMEHGPIEKQREFLWRLADAFDKDGRLVEAEEQLQELLDMPLSDEQRLEALCFLAEIQMKLETERQEAAVHATMEEDEQAHGKVTRTISSVRLLVDAARADEQEMEEGGVGDTLKAIVKRTLPCPKYARYHERHLQRFLSRLGAYPPRSATRNEKRVDAMRECVKMIATSAGGCCTSFPFEAAIWLLEEQEELCGGTVPIFGEEPMGQMQPAMPTQLNWYRGNSIVRGASQRTAVQRVQAMPNGNTEVVARVEQFGMKLAHQFPWIPAAGVAVGLALRRRFLSDPEAVSHLTRRQQIMATLKRGVEAGADSAAGWKALAELQYQNREWQDCFHTSVKGLEWSQRRRRAGHETLTHFALSLRLCVARCQRRLGRLDEAEYSFKVLAGWVTEGEVAFEGLSGSPPLSVRQQALRGIAKIAIQRGDRRAAKHQYERILGKVLLGRGPPAEHWAHAEYAWLQFEDGDLQAAKLHLEKALVAASKEGCGVTDSELAEHHFKLGRILWTMGGAMREGPAQARAHFESASMEESDIQAQACAWLGHWYNEVAQEYGKARNCYRQALALEPQSTVLAEKLEEMQRKLPAVSSFAGLPAFGNDSDDSDGEEGPPSTASSLMAAEARDKDPLNLPKGRAQSLLSQAQRAHSANSKLASLMNVGVRKQPPEPPAAGKS